MPAGEGIWSGDPATLASPGLGTWRTWVLESSDQLRPEPLPAVGATEALAEVANGPGR